MGKIELDHTGSGGGITLSSDGTDLLLNGTAVGGGGGSALELYAENPSTPTAPSATAPNGVAIGSGASTTGATAGVAIGEGASAAANEALALGKDATGNSRYTIAAGKSAYAGSFYCTAIGYNSYAAGANNATALTNSRASGADSLAAAIANNTSSYGATGANSIAMGYKAIATGNYSEAIGFQATSTNTHSVAIGRGTNSSGVNGSVALGYYADADGQSSIALGHRSKSRIIGELAFASSSITGNNGDSQTAIRVLISETTDATAEALTTNNSTASTDNQIILPNNSAYSFSGTIVARESAASGTDCAAWEVKGLIRREGSAGTTVLVNSATTVIDNTPSWGMALSADTTNGGLAITVTGAAATNIRWVATIHTSEVTYA